MGRQILPVRHSAWFERAYALGVGLKGIDGFLELAAGLLLLAAPQFVHQLLASFLHNAPEYPGGTYETIAYHIARIDDDLLGDGLSFLVIFLISHGVIKLLLVYCLLKRTLWTYPYALLFLGAFLAYQLYITYTSPSTGMALLTVLDVIIMYLVWGEWRELKKKR